MDELYKILYFNNQDPETVTSPYINPTSPFVVQHLILVRLLQPVAFSGAQRDELRGLPDSGLAD